jgi:acetyl esterase/lipase
MTRKHFRISSPNGGLDPDFAQGYWEGAVEHIPEGHAIDIRKHVPFGAHDGDRLTGDYYAPPGTGHYPALVAVHGGGWQLGTAESYQSWGPYLAHRGYVLFAINYRLVRDTKNRYPAAIHDTRAAVQ